MPWALSIAVFVIIWWTLLFAILPFGVRGQHEAGDHGAGHRSRAHRYDTASG